MLHLQPAIYQQDQLRQPYDIKFDDEGTLWVSCNARPCLLKVHPDTLHVTEVKLPLAGTTATPALRRRAPC